MAYYLVRAKPKQERLADLEKLLAQRAFADLRPFGQALTAGLSGARVGADGVAVWEEEDYCSPPLAMERAAVLDTYFDDIQVETVKLGEGWKRIRELPRLFPTLPTPPD
ncbi:MAG: hypothetical protein ACE5K9_00665 [Candidatus Methylomirabilales bacterium]